MNNKRELILDGKLNKTILMIAIPLMLNGFVYASYNYIDTLFVAQIGSLELASVALIGPLYNVLVAIGAGITISGTTLIGQSVGKNDHHKIQSLVLHLLMIASLLAIVFTGIGLIFPESILRLASATEGIIDSGMTYFKVLLISVPFMLMNAVFLSYKGGFGETAAIMKYQVASMIVKVAFNYIFIIVLNKGISYLAIATLIGQILVSFIAFYDLRHHKNKSKVIRNFSYNQTTMKEILRVSLPVIIERSSLSYSFVMVNSQVLKYGETVLAAYGITNRINSLFFRTIGGLGSGLATIVSQNYGNKNQARIHKVFRRGMIIGLIFSVVFAGIILFGQSRFAGSFAHEDLLLKGHVMNAVSVYSISIIPWCVFQVIMGMFTGAGATKYNLYITIARLYVFRLPSIMIMTQFKDLGAYSIWVAMLLSNLITALYAIILYKRHHATLFQFNR